MVKLWWSSSAQEGELKASLTWAQNRTESRPLCSVILTVLMHSALNHLSIKAIKLWFSAVHPNCAVFSAEIDDQAHMAVQSSGQGYPSPSQPLPLGSPCRDTGCCSGTCTLNLFPFSVIDPIISTVWPWNTLYFLFLSRLGRKLLGGLKRLYAKDDFCNLIWITIVTLSERGSFPTPLPGMI